MRLPETTGGRLFVGGLPTGTDDADLRRHFQRYGEVADVCVPRNRITGAPRLFAFVQFLRPSDAGRALADPHHVINARQVYIATAKPLQSERSRPSNQIVAPYKPLCQRVYRVSKHGYRVGDKMKISLGPLGDKYLQESQDVKKLRKFGGVIVDKVLIFECVIGYVSEDGKECLVRWPPVLDSKSAAMSGPGNIIPSWGCPLKDLAQFSSSGNVGRGFVRDVPNAESECPAPAYPHELGGTSQSWCWLMFQRLRQ